MPSHAFQFSQICCTNIVFFFLCATMWTCMGSTVINYPFNSYDYKIIKLFATVSKYYFPSPFLSWSAAWDLKKIKPEMLDNYSRIDSKAYLICSTAENYIIAFGLKDFIFFYGQSFSLTYVYPTQHCVWNGVNA